VLRFIRRLPKTVSLGPYRCQEPPVKQEGDFGPGMDVPEAQQVLGRGMCGELSNRAPDRLDSYRRR